MNPNAEIQKMLWDFMIFIIVLGVLTIAFGVFMFFYAKGLLPDSERWAILACFVLTPAYNTRTVIRAYKGKDRW